MGGCRSGLPDRSSGRKLGTTTTLLASGARPLPRATAALTAITLAAPRRSARAPAAFAVAVKTPGRHSVVTGCTGQALADARAAAGGLRQLAVDALRAHEVLLGARDRVVVQRGHEPGAVLLLAPPAKRHERTRQPIVAVDDVRADRRGSACAVAR